MDVMSQGKTAKYFALILIKLGGFVEEVKIFDTYQFFKQKLVHFRELILLLKHVQLSNQIFFLIRRERL